jgi:lysophospholipid acyltransferase (LPLAT)-like uncharacterized protein
MSASAPAISDKKTGEQPFTLKQRIALWFITLTGYLAIRLIGPTLKFECSMEEGGPATTTPHPAVYVFWHRVVIAACWYYRNRQIAVMTSSSFDGEYIARIIEKFGFKAVRGSSSRGAVRALLGMHTELEQDRSVAFTIDGPRGPLYGAKPGPVLLARNTRVPIVPFFIAAEDGWVLKSWDRFVIPKPYTRVHLRLGRFIPVPPEADASQIQQLHAEMQAGLDRVREYAETQFPAIKTRA